MHSQDPPMCRRCVLTTNVPNVGLDDDGICNVCAEYEANKVLYDAYFKSEAELAQLFENARRADSDHDVLLMYSGGRDSTYVLYRLAEMGLRILALTFDNGYIPEACFENIRGVCADLDVESVVVSVDKSRMDQVFSTSLKEDSTVCSGCFRGLTARGTELAIGKNIPVIVTGLSRGQIFDTKVHQLLAGGVTDPEQIDEYLMEFRELYHDRSDTISELIEDRVLADRAAFRKTHFIDYYRYSATTKQQIVDFLEQRAPFWRKPSNVGGCSSNCLINDAGIHVHRQTRGYHNYAIPLAWDVRLGHITRDVALLEMGETLDGQKIQSILTVLGVEI